MKNMSPELKACFLHMPVCTAVFFALACLTAELLPLQYLYGAPDVICFALCGTVIFAAALPMLKSLGIAPSGRHFYFAASFTALALILRFTMFDIASGDYNSFLVEWVSQLRDAGGTEGLALEIGNYNTPYMFILWLISKSDMLDLYLIKFVSSFFDVLLAFFCAKLVPLKADGRNILTIVFFTVLYLPTVVSNSAWWAQCDSIYVSLALGGLYFFLRGKGYAGSLLMAASLCFKLQAVFIFPVLLVLLALGIAKVRHLLVMPVVYLISISPALLAGRDFSSVFMIYFSQLDEYEDLSLNCPNIYSLFMNYSSEALASAGLVAGFVFAAAVTVLMMENRRFLDTHLILKGAFLISFGLILILPHMHERYSYLSDILIIAVAASERKYIKAAVALQLCSLLSYLWFLCESYPISFEYLALLRIAILLYMCAEYYSTLTRKSIFKPHKV